MSRTEKKRRAQTLTAQESSYTLRPWSCNHYPNYSEIEAYLPITGDFEIIADIHDTKGVDAEVVAGAVTPPAKSYAKNTHPTMHIAPPHLFLPLRPRRL